MISFRYHIASIVAVFLALGLGLLAGSSFGQPALVEQLRGRTADQLATIDALRAEVDAGQGELSDLRAFAEAVAGRLVAGTLQGREVLIVSDPSVDAVVEGRARAALEEAGATVLFTLSARPGIVSEEPEDLAALAAILGVAPPGDGSLGGATAEMLAARLVLGAPTLGDDPLSALLSAGYLASTRGQVDEGIVADLGGPDLIVVVLAAASDAEAGDPATDFFAPLVRALDDGGAIVAAGAAASADAPWFDPIGLGSMVAVADLDRPSGGVALALGLAHRIATGEGGSYGPGGDPIPEPLP